MIGGETTVLGIFGWPVHHSRSPAMHNAAAAAVGVDLAYVPFPVQPESLAEAVAGVRALGIRGVNVTLPHKEEVMRYLDVVHPDARDIGAVNTLVREADGSLHGENTDAPGLVRSLEEAEVALADARVVIVGAGGAARAAAVGLARAGAAEIVVAARRGEQSELLASDLDASLEGRVRAITTEGADLREAFRSATLMVQATSATLHGNPQAKEFAASLPMDALDSEAHVIDLVYKPRVTSVMASAQIRGLRTVDGLGMLVHQGALAFTRWTGIEAPVEVMREALLASL